MRILFLGFIFLFFTAQAQVQASFDEVAKPEEMVSCIQTYIINWIVPPDRFSSWEHRPAYEFLGKYFFASWHWHTIGSLYYFGSLNLMVGPNAPAPIYCDYPIDASGMPDRNNGFCKAKVESGDVFFNYAAYNNQGEEINFQKKIAVIKDSKIFCLNRSRP